MELIQKNYDIQCKIGNCLKVSEVAQKLGIGISTVWQKLKVDPSFPRSFQLFDEGNTTRWLESEIDNFIIARKNGSAK